MSGLFLFYSEQNNCITSTPAAYKTGIGWVFLAAISWAVYAILIKLLVQKHPPMQLNLVIFGLPALLYFPFVNLSVFFHLSVVDWLIMIFLGLNTLVAYGTLALAIQYTEAKKVSVILILNPLITMGIMGIIGLTKATWITHEKYTLISIIGALTMLSGAIFTILKPKEKIVLPPD